MNIKHYKITIGMEASQLAQNPEWMELFNKVFREIDDYVINKGKPGESRYRDLFTQYPELDGWVAGYVVSQIHPWIASELGMIISVDTGVPLLPSHSHEKRMSILRDIHPPFLVTDAHPNPKEDIPAWVRWLTDAPFAPSHQAVNSLPCVNLPLFWGDCPPEALLYQTFRGSRGTGAGWARWCYHTQNLVIFAIPPKPENVSPGDWFQVCQMNFSNVSMPLPKGQIIKIESAKFKKRR